MGGGGVGCRGRAGHHGDGRALRPDREEAPADKPHPGIYFESSEPGGKTELVALEGAMPSNSYSGVGVPFKKPKITTTLGGDRAPEAPAHVAAGVPLRLRPEHARADDDGPRERHERAAAERDQSEAVRPRAARRRRRDAQAGRRRREAGDGGPVSSGVFRVRIETPLPPGEQGSTSAATAACRAASSGTSGSIP